MGNGGLDCRYARPYDSSERRQVHGTKTTGNIERASVPAVQPPIELLPPPPSGACPGKEVLPCFPTNAYLPANQGLLTPQLTPVWKPSNACLSSCKTSLFSIRFICLNISALHSLPLSSPIPVAAGSSSQHRKKELSVAAFISCGDERSGQRTSRGLKKTPLADSDGTDPTRIPASSSSLQGMAELYNIITEYRKMILKQCFF